ncbi:MAG: polysaccharide biosynthesis PFTS motif protein [Propionivibrio sp.]|uniref:polysaccharide biosynthesis PFTS motif protein n=1 Tax=Propionivibrio sp. TaxID=2212460 RepID=UPI0025E03462|nr:polysaccharide biosynthesis PFTS motif protein [Propionivibrio sp.]MBK8893366.1 polysaccharide biosynthesis PFTS motif protein [Propionivibrio sp.]
MPIRFKKLLSLFSEMMKRIQRARLRRIIRGYRVLKQSGQLDRIAVVKQALTEHPLELPKPYFASLVMGAGAASGEIVVRQYLLIRVGDISLNCALLLALSEEQGRVVFPLPREWRDVLTQHGFKVARFKSAVLWQCYVCALLVYGVAQIVRVVFAGPGSGKDTVLNQQRHVYFAALGPGNLPQKVNGSQSHDVISWYLQWPGRKPDIEAVHHGVANSLPLAVGSIAVLPQPRPLPDLAGWGAILNYAVWGLGASVIAALDCLRGRWWHALLLNQAAQAAQVRFLPVDSLAREYLFHNSGWIYRPLWTYEAERLGSAITFYFYSTNCESFKKPGGYPSVFFGYKAMNWPRYLVWDEYQADFVRRAAGAQAKISVVGPIWFQSSAVAMPGLDKHGVAVFDITPHRGSRYCTLGMDSEFYTPAVANPFLLHVSNATQQHGVLMLWKRKRNVGRIAHPLYRRLADQLAESSHVVLDEPDILPTASSKQVFP